MTERLPFADFYISFLLSPGMLTVGRTCDQPSLGWAYRMDSQASRSLVVSGPNKRREREAPYAGPWLEITSTARETVFFSQDAFCVTQVCHPR